MRWRPISGRLLKQPEGPGKIGDRVEEAGKDAKKAAATAFGVAEDTRKKAEVADRAGGEAISAAVAANKLVDEATHEAMMKTVEELPAKLVKKVLTSWEFMVFILLVLVSSIFAAVAISVGISAFGG
jgi:hypothetical protein